MHGYVCAYGDGTAMSTPELVVNGLTEIGHKTVADSMEEALERVVKAKKELNDAKKHAAWMLKVSDCQHDIEIVGSFIFIESKCKRCGFTWME